LTFGPAPCCLLAVVDFAQVQHLPLRYSPRLQTPASHRRVVPAFLSVLDSRIAQKHPQLQNARILPACIEGRSPLQALAKMFYSVQMTYCGHSPKFRTKSASTAKVGLSAHAAGIPSSTVKTTSVVNPRMVRVAGATMISFSRSMTSFRVRIKTGRRLSGSRNVYQRISPRFAPHPPNHLRPKRAAPRPPKTRRAKVVGTGKRARPHPAARQSTAADVRVP